MIIFCILFNLIQVSGNLCFFLTHCTKNDSDLFYSFATLYLMNLSCCDFTEGSSLSEKVYQSPAEMFVSPGDSATITCSHSIDDFDRILWYKQSGKQLHLLGYMNVMHAYPEPGEKVKIDGSATKDKNCTLTVQELSSSAVYFCAARYHSAADHSASDQKTSLLEAHKLKLRPQNDGSYRRSSNNQFTSRCTEKIFSRTDDSRMIVLFLSLFLNFLLSGKTRK